MEESRGGYNSIEEPSLASLQDFHESVLDLLGGMLFTTLDDVLRRDRVSREEFERQRDKGKGGSVLYPLIEPTEGFSEPFAIQALSRSFERGEHAYRRSDGRKNILPLFRRAQDRLSQELYGECPISFHDLVFKISVACFLKAQEYLSHFDYRCDERLKKSIARGAKLKANFEAYRAVLEIEAARAANILSEDLQLANGARLPNAAESSVPERVLSPAMNSLTEPDLSIVNSVDLDGQPEDVEDPGEADEEADDLSPAELSLEGDGHGKRLPTLESVERKIPKIELGDGNWISTKVASNRLGVKIKTLANHRAKGEKLKMGNDAFGRHSEHCHWRKSGSDHPLYYLPTMTKNAGQLGIIYPRHSLDGLKSLPRDAESSRESSRDK